LILRRDIPESLNLANRILATLTSNVGGWLCKPPVNGSFLLGGIEGVQIWRHPEADETVKRAVDTLVQSLNAEGVSAVLKLENPNNPKENKINVNVGTKP
jgi:hypothetical protein